MVLGGLKKGVTPLGWAYAYRTIGNNGDRVSGTLAPRPGDSPVAYTQVTDKDGNTIKGGDNDSDPRTGDLDRKPPKRRRASSKRSSPAAPGPRPRSAPKASGARRARPRTTATPGSAAAIGDEVTACVWVGYAEHDDADEDALQRRPGDGRHLPGADLGQRDAPPGRKSRPNRAAAKRRTDGRPRSRAAVRAEYVAGRRIRIRARRRPKASRSRRPETEAPETEARPKRRPEATPERLRKVAERGGGGGVTAG